MNAAPLRFRLASWTAPAWLGLLALALSLSTLAQQPVLPTDAQQTATPASDSSAAQAPVAAPAQTTPALPQPAPTPAAQAPASAAPAASTTDSTQSLSTAHATPSAGAPAGQPTPKSEVQTAADKADAADAIEAVRSGAITEEELKRLLVGKALYLRGGYLENSLSFNENGRLFGHSPQGSFTLCAVEIERVRLTKHKVFLEGSRYGLHFVGQLAYEDPSKAVDRVRITPKKKVLKITIDREMVVKPKKKKEAKAEKEKEKQAEKTAKTSGKAAGAAPAAAPAAPVAAAPVSAAPEPEELSPADQLKASIAAAPEEERPADPDSVTTTLYAAHATKVLKDALDQIFAQAFDDRMMAAMPDFWKLYYQAVADKVDYRPKDPSILRQNTVDQKARLLTNFEPDSNEFAQAAAVAGMALYHVVIGPDGKAGEIAVARPIGFGLDENAVAAIRKASFQPAMKDGKPVPVLLDLIVQFRIFSKRTAVHAEPEPVDKPKETILPGPYSVPR